MIFDSMMDDSSAAVGWPFFAAAMGAARKARDPAMARGADLLSKRVRDMLRVGVASASVSCRKNLLPQAHAVSRSHKG